MSLKVGKFAFHFWFVALVTVLTFSPYASAGFITGEIIRLEGQDHAIKQFMEHPRREYKLRSWGKNCPEYYYSLIEGTDRAKRQQIKSTHKINLNGCNNNYTRLPYLWNDIDLDLLSIFYFGILEGENGKPDENSAKWARAYVPSVSSGASKVEGSAANLRINFLNYLAFNYMENISKECLVELDEMLIPLITSVRFNHLSQVITEDTDISPYNLAQTEVYSNYFNEFADYPGCDLDLNDSELNKLVGDIQKQWMKPGEIHNFLKALEIVIRVASAQPTFKEKAITAERKRQAEIEKRNKIELKKQKQKEEQDRHIKQLKSGEIKPSNFEEAIISYGADKNGTMLIAFPPAQATNEKYNITGILEDIQGNDLLCKISGAGTVSYFKIKLNPAIMNRIKGSLKFNYPVHAIAKHIGKESYSTVSGTKRYMSVFEGFDVYTPE